MPELAIPIVELIEKDKFHKIQEFQEFLDPIYYAQFLKNMARIYIY